MGIFSLLLERHDSPAAFNCLNANRLHAENALFCVEFTKFNPESGQPDLSPLTEDQIRSQCNDSRFLSHQVVLSLLIKLRHQSVYFVDPYEKCLNIVELAMRAITPEDRIMERFSDILSKTLWVRDQSIANCLFELLVKYPEKNVLAILGRKHYGVIYHLIYLFLSNNLPLIPMGLIDLKEDKFEAQESFRFDFYAQAFPVEFFDCSEKTGFPQLQDFVKTPAFSYDAINRFKENYQNRDKSYQLVREKVEELFRISPRTFNLLKMADNGLGLSQQQVNQLQSFIEIFRKMGLFFEQTELPSNTGELGSELYPASHPFMIRHHNPSLPYFRPKKT